MKLWLEWGDGAASIWLFRPETLCQVLLFHWHRLKTRCCHFLCCSGILRVYRCIGTPTDHCAAASPQCSCSHGYHAALCGRRGILSIYFRLAAVCMLSLLHQIVPLIRIGISGLRAYQFGTLFQIPLVNL